MKRNILVILTLALCLLLCSCNSNEQAEESTAEAVSEQQTTEEETQLPEESTTKQPEEDEQKGSELKSTLESFFTDGEITGDFNIGKFTFKNNRDADVVYAYERSDDLEEEASDNAEELVDEISSFYSDEITLYDSVAEQIGSGENGIDSVRYKFYYINEQNQILTIYADSDGVISYADCEFAW